MVQPRAVADPAPAVTFAALAPVVDQVASALVDICAALTFAIQGSASAVALAERMRSLKALPPADRLRMRREVDTESAERAAADLDVLVRMHRITSHVSIIMFLQKFDCFGSVAHLILKALALSLEVHVSSK